MFTALSKGSCYIHPPLRQLHKPSTVYNILQAENYICQFIKMKTNIGCVAQR